MQKKRNIFHFVLKCPNIVQLNNPYCYQNNLGVPFKNHLCQSTRESRAQVRAYVTHVLEQPLFFSACIFYWLSVIFDFIWQLIMTKFKRYSSIMGPFLSVRKLRASKFHFSSRCPFVLDAIFQSY